MNLTQLLPHVTQHTYTTRYDVNVGTRTSRVVATSNADVASDDFVHVVQVG